MKRAQLPLTALRAFEVTARTKSLKDACAELHLTAGAISQQVRALENRLSIKLFDRTNGRYELTPIGAKLLPRLTHSFDAMESALRDVADHAEPNRLRLKLSPTFAARWMAPRLGSFFSRNPDIALEVTSIGSHTSEISLDDCDFMVQFGTPPWPEFEEILLFQDELVVVCIPQISQTLRTPADLREVTLLHSAFRWGDWERWLAPLGLESGLAERGPKFPNAVSALEAAYGGLGVACTQRAYVQGELEQGRLVMPFDHVARSDNSYYMASYKHRQTEHKIRDFSNWLREIVRPCGSPQVPR